MASVNYIVVIGSFAVEHYLKGLKESRDIDLLAIKEFWQEHSETTTAAIQLIEIRLKY
jgi:hypothetical protein